MSYDFNGADRQSSGFDPIPAGTIVPLTMSIRPGGAGDGGWFKQSQSSDALMLDCEFVVSEGPYVKRKIWQFLIVSGGKLNERGESTAGNITRLLCAPFWKVHGAFVPTIWESPHRPRAASTAGRIFAG